VHGDVGQARALVGSDGSVRCLVGWEHAVLGDARCDVGLLLARCEYSDRVPAGRQPVELPVVDLAERYAVAGGVADDLPWFVALGHWWLACAADVRGDGAEAEGRAELALELLSGV
jgi:aminoglycoside phosphotransferase (APT) family kinase protein